MVVPVATALLQIRAGKVRALAVLAEQRIATLPDVPTGKEAGVDGFTMPVWYGMFAPAATPPAVVAQLNADVNALLQQPDVRESLARPDLIAVGGSPERFGEMVRRNLARWTRVVAAAKSKAD